MKYVTDDKINCFYNHNYHLWVFCTLVLLLSVYLLSGELHKVVGMYMFLSLCAFFAFF